MEPDRPQNLEELVFGEKMQILTMSRGFDTFEEFQVCSLLTNHVIPNLMWDDAIPNQRKEMYVRLGNAVHFTTSIFPVAFNISSRGVFRNSKGSEVFLGNQRAFAVVDAKVEITLFERYLSLFGKYKLARTHSALSFYTTRSYYIMFKNFFADIFNTGFTSLVESGIYGRWLTNYRFARFYKESDLGSKEINESLDLLNGEDVEATTVKHVTVPFVIYLGMILASVAIFVVEFIHSIEMLLQSNPNLVRKYSIV